MQALIRFLWILNVRSDDSLVGPDCGDKIAPGPELVTNKISPLVVHILSHPDRTLAFEKAYDRRHTMFSRNGDEHMHVMSEG
ncbi:MAG: hypothetical protein ETSY1_41990 [Candidatus Entotheonella factor]|uniref:Uncharacterized protein n=1 Tax=Entotheonella factor TaxID=1429438 RepID=W4L580_ENTF1|nr:MAG: hypothetical protein ETSY1_41990 [Candidatus Entotheonella factor]